MRNESISLLKEKDMCVLATVSDNRPHCSLMAYMTNEAGTEIYMVTYRNSRKFRNLVQNPAVSFLVDTREENPGDDRRKTKALTVTGTVEIVKDPKKAETIRTRLLRRHPHLASIVQGNESEVISVKVRSFLLLDGPTDAHFEGVD